MVDDQQLLKDREKLLNHLLEETERINTIIEDEEQFCNQSIDESMQRIEKYQKQLIDKLKQLKDKLNNIRNKNNKMFADNKADHENQLKLINDLYENCEYENALIQLRKYQETFENRPNIISEIPKLHLNELDFDRYFSTKPVNNLPLSDVKQDPSPPILTKKTVQNDDSDSEDNRPLTNKQKLRSEKRNELDTLSADENEDQTDLEQVKSRSNFTTWPKSLLISNNQVSGVEKKTEPQYFSRRLASMTNMTDVTLPNSKTSPINDNYVSQNIKSVCLYKHSPNTFLLMGCSSNYIVLYKSNMKTSNQMSLGCIERRTQVDRLLEWNDGLIVSMCYINNNSMCIFTEREMSIYSITKSRKVKSRILPRGNDNFNQISSNPHEDPHRGIGAADCKNVYHIYSNRQSNWTLETLNIESFITLGDLDLTIAFNDVQRFIHFCCNEETMNFLVQMNDFSYAILYGPKSRINTRFYRTVILEGAIRPLTICSAKTHSKKTYLVVNDPSAQTLYILSSNDKLNVSKITAHAISYVEERDELMIVTDNIIGSIDLL